MEHLPDGGIRRPPPLEVPRTFSAISRDRHGHRHRKKIRAPHGSTAMAKAAGGHGEIPMIIVEKKLIPSEILKESVLVHLAAAYYSVAKQLEQKTECSQTRGFILSTLRGGASRNQNQIATLLGFDRTVVHRAIKTMIQEGLLSERKELSPSEIPTLLWLLKVIAEIRI